MNKHIKYISYNGGLYNTYSWLRWNQILVIVNKNFFKLQTMIENRELFEK